MNKEMIILTITDGKPYINQVKGLIKEYVNALDRDLSFQNIDDELKDPSVKYTAPEGELLVAVDKETVCGMVAYHRHSETRCEMKRLYVKPSCRGEKLGEKLICEIMKRAKEAGYKEMVLDTIEPLKAAVHLYEKYEFKRCEPYYNNPMSDVIYFRAIL